MSDDRHRAAEELIDRLLPYPAPPQDFAQRVLNAAEAGPSPQPRARLMRRRPRLFWAATSMLAAALVLLVWGLARHTPSDGRASDILAERRETLHIGDHVVAVLEPQADLGWQEDGGRLRVDQREGEVFYRVDKGGTGLLVATPAGDVLVTGTCFRVTLQGRAGQRSALVDVLEGSLEVRTDQGRIRLAAGEWSRLSPGRLPERRLREMSRPATAGLSLAGVGSLRGELAMGGRDGGHAVGSSGRLLGSKVFPLTADERKLLARACNFRWGLPKHIARGSTIDLDRVVALTLEQRAAVGRTIEEHRTQHIEALRALYAEVIGDPVTAKLLSAIAIHHEIDAKATSADGVDARRLILQEWAGDVPPPADPSSRPAIERFWRLQVSALDVLARRLTPIVGQERADAVTEATIDGMIFGEEPDCPSGRGSATP